MVTVALRLTIYLLCVLGLLQLYGLNTFLWLVDSALGLRVLSASGTLLVTIVLAFGAGRRSTAASSNIWTAWSETPSSPNPLGCGPCCRCCARPC